MAKELIDVIPEAPVIPTLNDFIAFSRRRHFSRSDRFMVQFSSPPGLRGIASIPIEETRQGQQISTTDLQDLTLLCEEAAFPGKNIQPSILRVNAMNEYRAGAVDYMGDITFQFLVDSEWTPRQFMDAWMYLCSGGGSFQKEPNREVGFYKDYTADINLYALVPALGWFQEDHNSPTPSDVGLRRGDLKGNVMQNVLQRSKKIASDQLDKIATKVGSYIDPRVSSYRDEIKRVLNKYREGVNPFNDVVPERAVWGMTLKECWPRSINPQQVSNSNLGFNRLVVTFTYKYWVPHFLYGGVRYKYAETENVWPNQPPSSIIDRVRKTINL